MLPRDPQEEGRVATALELFFDLVFVIAVSGASEQLHEKLVEGHVAAGLFAYLAVFFAIWWAWMNFTWFATSFDTDDWLYRTLTIMQMGGVLVLAAGIPAVFAEHDFTLVVLGYVVMRIVLVVQWLRASRTAGRTRRTTRTYAVGIAVVQALWLSALALPPTWFPIIFGALVLAEISVPVIAELQGETPIHPHHITERYGLFTLILLGESLLGSSNAIIEALRETEDLASLLWVAVLALVTTAGLWWIYFWPPHHAAVPTLQRSLLYGYGHYLIFAAAGAVSVGIEVEIDLIAGSGELARPLASFAHSIPVAVFLLGVWALAIRPVARRAVNIAVPTGALLVLVDPLLPVPVALTALFLVAIVIVLERHRAAAPAG
jgi:low temperature requirement protein LtrA